MKTDYQPQIVVNEHDKCGENPLYDALRGILYWCDIPPGIIWALDARSGAHRLVYQGAECGAFTLQTDGNLLLFPGHDALILNPHSGQTTPLQTQIVSETGRFNDCIVAPEGRIFAGTMGQQKSGALFALDADLGADLGAVRICGDTGCSNGMAWTPDLKRLYWTDSTAKTIYLFDYDAQNGALSNQRVWLHTPEMTPDGLTIDIDGNLWIAFYSGACVRHYNSGAELLRQVDLPAPNITSCIFGGPDFADLYITSASQSAKEHPLAGALFRIRPEVGGKAEFRSAVGLT